MSGEHWRPYTEPPNNSRHVMLRFGDDGQRDRRGYFSMNYQLYAGNQSAEHRHEFVHPTHWRELTEVERRGY